MTHSTPRPLIPGETPPTVPTPGLPTPGLPTPGLRLFVDGEIYGLQTAGGINRYFDELLPRIAAATGEPACLMVPRAAPQAGPDRGATRARRFPLSGRRGYHRLPAALQGVGRAWEDRRWVRRIDAAPRAVFHPSLFATLPLTRTPTVVTVYDMIQERFRDLFHDPGHDRFLARKKRCVTGAARVLAISEATKADVCDLYALPPERVTVTPLAADNAYWQAHATPAAAAGFRDRCGLPEPYLLFVGARAGYKNFDRLAEAFARWKNRDALMLAVVGGPWTPEEDALLDRLRIRDRVTHCGRVDNDELAGAYAGAAAFVYPSRYEGFGLPPLEAMACGAPVAASAAGSIPEVVGDAAELFDPEDVDAIAAALTRVVEPARAEALRAAGRRRIGAFSWDRTAGLTLAAYRRALADAA